MGKFEVYPQSTQSEYFGSHDLENCECTRHFPHQENFRKTSSENSECTGNVPDGYITGTLSIYLQCICNVPDWKTEVCPQCLGSRRERDLRDARFRCVANDPGQETGESDCDEWSPAGLSGPLYPNTLSVLLVSSLDASLTSHYGRSSLYHGEIQRVK